MAALIPTITTGTLAAGSTTTFGVLPGSTLRVVFPPNARATVTEAPVQAGASDTAVKLNNRVTNIKGIPQSLVFGPYPTGANVTVVVATNSGSSATWEQVDAVQQRTFYPAVDDIAGKSPYDTYGQTAGRVSAVTLGATVFSGGVVKNVFDAGAYDYLRIYGVPYKAGFTGYSGLLVVNGSGYISLENPSGVGTTSQNLRGVHMRVRFKAKQVQIKCKGFGLSSDFFPMWLDAFDGKGFQRVSFTAGAVASDSYIQIDLTRYGEYELIVGMEQSLSVGAVVLDADGEFVSVARAPALVVFGDSYVQGTTSPAVNGDPCLIGAMSMISGLNVIPLGVSGTGYVHDGGIGYPITHAERLAMLTNVINASGAPAVMSVFGLNDADNSVSTANTQAAATTVINHLLATTSANILLTGAEPATRNNSAAIRAVDAGIAAAVTAANSSRVAFAPISGASPRRIYGARDTDTATGTAGNTRYIMGNDGTHLSPSFTQIGTEFYARYMLELLENAAVSKGWYYQ